MDTHKLIRRISINKVFNLLMIILIAGLGLGVTRYYLFKSVQKQGPKPDFFSPARFNLTGLPHNKDGNIIRYGYKLITKTSAIIGPDVNNPAMRFSGNNLACQNCHLNAGHKMFAAPFVGVTGLFPQYNKRANKVITIEDRINGCMQRSMNGRKLPPDSKEMIAIVAYMHWLSRDVPSGKKVYGSGFVKISYPDRQANLPIGKKIFLTLCVSCHGKNGQGKKWDSSNPAKGYQFPALWGNDSFNEGAGMHRLLTAAAFIKGNMPFGTTYKKPVLTDDEAYDVAAYINSKERPSLPSLNKDFPVLSLKPADCPYPPYADHFSRHQHQYGPFQPIIKAHKNLAKPANRFKWH